MWQSEQAAPRSSERECSLSVAGRSAGAQPNAVRSEAATAVMSGHGPKAMHLRSFRTDTADSILSVERTEAAPSSTCYEGRLTQQNPPEEWPSGLRQLI